MACNADRRGLLRLRSNPRQKIISPQPQCGLAAGVRDGARAEQRPYRLEIAGNSQGPGETADGHAAGAGRGGMAYPRPPFHLPLIQFEPASDLREPVAIVFEHDALPCQQLPEPFRDINR